MQTIMTYSFPDYFTYSIEISTFHNFLSVSKSPILGVPVWADGKENEEMGQTDPQYHLHVIIQSWKGPQGAFLKHTLTFCLEKVKFNIWNATHFLWEGSRILQCIFRCKQDFLQIDATFLDKVFINDFNGCLEYLKDFNNCQSRYPDKGNARVHQQFLPHCFHACKYKGILNQEKFFLFTAKEPNIFF